MATSRESLGIAGEVTWGVPSLSVPDVRQVMDKETVAASEAVRLFIQRAQAAQPELDLTDQNAGTVAQVCQRLDGIPLAIELAAARARVLTIEQIATRLAERDRFRLLTGGSRTALERQQTLRATIDWSYQLLSEPERALLGRLSVFSGGWTLEAAEQVASGGGLDADDVLDLLARLVSKSLVVMSSQQADAPRYRLLETIREYALERLVASGEFKSVRRKHMLFFCGLAQEADPQLTGPLRDIWLEKLKAEEDNLRAALQWARESGDALVGLQLAGALWWFWYSLSNVSERRRWLESALAQAAKLHAPAERAKALSGAGNLAWFQGDYVVAHLLLEEALAICRELGASARRDLATSLLWMGAVERDQGNLTIARSLLEESAVICREAREQWTLALVLVTLGRTMAVAGHTASARPILEEARTIFREFGDMWGQALALNNMGLVAFREAEYGRAIALYQESIALFWHFEERGFTVRCVEELAWATCKQGHYERATRLFGAAKAQREAFGASMPPAAYAEHDQYVADARAQLNAAAFTTAWAEGRDMTMEQALAYASEDDEPVQRQAARG